MDILVVSESGTRAIAALCGQGAILNLGATKEIHLEFLLAQPCRPGLLSPDGRWACLELEGVPGACLYDLGRSPPAPVLCVRPQYFAKVLTNNVLYCYSRNETRPFWEVQADLVRSTCSRSVAWPSLGPRIAQLESAWRTYVLAHELFGVVRTEYDLAAWNFGEPIGRHPAALREAAELAAVPAWWEPKQAQIRALLRPWTPQTHRLYFDLRGPANRTIIHLLMCAARLGAGGGTPGLPRLPPEMWRTIMEFLTIRPAQCCSLGCVSGACGRRGWSMYVCSNSIRWLVGPDGCKTALSSQDAAIGCSGIRGRYAYCNVYKTMNVYDLDARDVIKSHRYTAGSRVWYGERFVRVELGNVLVTEDGNIERRHVLR